MPAPDLPPLRFPATPIYQFTEQLVEIDEGKVLYFYAFYPGQLAPVAMCLLDLDESAGWVMGLWVDAEHRRRGLASSLVSRAVVRSKKEGKETVGLSVADDNLDAARLYRSLGFRTYTKGNKGCTQMVKQL